MIKTILAFLIVVLTQGVKAQDEKTVEINSRSVPQRVVDGFNRIFVNATDVEWAMLGSDYMVTFEINNSDQYAMLNPFGTVTEQGKEITDLELPPVVASAVKRDYPNHRIDDAYMMSRDGSINYKMDLDGSPDRKVIYSADGKIIEDKVKGGPILHSND